MGHFSVISSHFPPFWRQRLNPKMRETENKEKIRRNSAAAKIPCGRGQTLAGAEDKSSNFKRRNH